MEYKREPVKGYEEYEVDTNGVVYGKNGKPLKYSLNPNGYCIVKFSINHLIKGFTIHRLVAKQFINNKDVNKTQINHIDGDKTNNKVDNLEWVTPKENMEHAKNVLNIDRTGKNSPSAKKIKGIHKTTNEILYFDSISDAGRYFTKINNHKRIANKIWEALNGYKKTYYGYIWKYC